MLTFYVKPKYSKSEKLEIMVKHFQYNNKNKLYNN